MVIFPLTSAFASGHFCFQLATDLDLRLWQSHFCGLLQRHKGFFAVWENADAQAELLLTQPKPGIIEIVIGMFERRA